MNERVNEYNLRHNRHPRHPLSPRLFPSFHPSTTLLPGSFIPLYPRVCSTALHHPPNLFLRWHSLRLPRDTSSALQTERRRGGKRLGGETSERRILQVWLNGLELRNPGNRVFDAEGNRLESYGLTMYRFLFLYGVPKHLRPFSRCIEHTATPFSLCTSRNSLGTL